MTKPVVAIVGRPNVGKSTLFNRLLGERRAIVEDVPGTTRDRVYADVTLGERPVTLVDTGGLELSPESDLRKRVKKQVEVAIQEADVIIFLVDVCDGVTVPDQEVAQELRRSRKPVVLAVNKVDNPQRHLEVAEFYELDSGGPLPVSAYHGLGVSDLVEEVGALLPPPAEAPEAPQAAVMKLAIVGRPNVGKSLLVNALLGQERVIVSEAPGTTRDAIDTPFEYKGQPVVLIDTAGLRRRGRVEGGIERYSVMRAFRAIARADVALLVTEAAEVITAQDTHITGYVWEAHKGLVVVVNKWDLAPALGLDALRATGEVRQRLRFLPQVPLLFVSALTGEGVEGILPEVWKLWSQMQQRVPTSALNETLQAALAAHAPPAVGRRRLKVFYATQAEVNPPTFVLFVNDPKLLHFSYRRYLENQLRGALGFTTTPLRLLFRRRRKGEE